MTRHLLASRPPLARILTWLHRAPNPKLPPMGFSSPSFWFLYNPAILGMCSLGPLFVSSLLALSLSPHYSSRHFTAQLVQSAGHVQCVAFSPSSGLFQMPWLYCCALPHTTWKTFPSSTTWSGYILNSEGMASYNSWDKLAKCVCILTYVCIYAHKGLAQPKSSDISAQGMVNDRNERT